MKKTPERSAATARKIGMPTARDGQKAEVSEYAPSPGSVLSNEEKNVIRLAILRVGPRKVSDTIGLSRFAVIGALADTGSTPGTIALIRKGLDACRSL